MKKFLALGLVWLGAAWAQAPEMPGHVNLRVLPALAKEVDAYPRVVANAAVSADAAQRINARFDKLDVGTRKERADCLQSGRESHNPGDYSHSVKATMRGPRFLSVTAEDSYFCGGAHPDIGMVALVYDVTTGAGVDWAAVLPGAKKGDAAGDASDATLVYWPELTKRALAAAEKDCKEVYQQGPMEFVVWLDGDRGALMAEPSGVPHAAGACVEDVALDAGALRALGVKAEVVDALTAALHDPSPLAVKRRAEAKK